MFPAVRASHKPTYVIVPHEPELSAKFTATALVNIPLEDVPKFVLLFVNTTRAYDPIPVGSVAPVPSKFMVEVERPT
jgi:hypothetical protein